MTQSHATQDTPVTNDDQQPDTQHPCVYDTFFVHIVFALAMSLTVTVGLGLLGYLVGKLSQ